MLSEPTGKEKTQRSQRTKSQSDFKLRALCGYSIGMLAMCTTLYE